jgi:hypothetical protein
MQYNTHYTTCTSIIYVIFKSIIKRSERRKKCTFPLSTSETVIICITSASTTVTIFVFFFIYNNPTKKKERKEREQSELWKKKSVQKRAKEQEKERPREKFVDFILYFYFIMDKVSHKYSIYPNENEIHFHCMIMMNE